MNRRPLWVAGRRRLLVGTGDGAIDCTRSACHSRAGRRHRRRGRGLLGAILGRQVEREHIPKYQTALQAGKVLVVIHGASEEVAAARRVTGENNSENIATYGAKAA